MTKMNATKFPVLTHISYSGMKVFLEGPEEFKYQYLEGNKKGKTPAMELGSVVDCLITQPDKFESKYAVRRVEAPTSANQKAFADEIVSLYLEGVQPLADVVYKNHYSTKGKTEEKIVQEASDLFKKIKPYMEYIIDLRQNNKTEISEELYEKATAIAHALANHPIAKFWLIDSEGEFQKELRWKSTVIDLDILGFLDKVVYDHEQLRALVLDLKVMDCKNEREFKRKVRQFLYHLQMFVYTTGLANTLFAETGQRYQVDHLFVVVNSNNPHQVMCIQLDDGDLEVGGELFYEAAEGLKEALGTGVWSKNKTIKIKVFNRD